MAKQVVVPKRMYMFLIAMAERGVTMMEYYLEPGADKARRRLDKEKELKRAKDTEEEANDEP